jgi:drug/metabolite transporter (DMT)-like permease
MNQLELSSSPAPSKSFQSILSLSIALLAVSFAPIFIRFSQTELGSNATVFNRLFIFSVVFGLGKGISNYFKKSPKITIEKSFSTKEWILLLSVGLISIFSLGLWAISLEYTTVAKSMLLNNLTPVFTTLGGWLLFRQSFDRKFLLGMVIALSGAIALGFEDLQGETGYLIGDIYALLSAVFLAGYFLVVEQLRERFTATTILLWRCTVGSLLLLPIVLITEGQLFPKTLTAILAIIGLGIISEGLGQRLLADCMDKFSSSFIALFLLLEPIISAILAWFIFGENFSFLTWVGFAVILSGISLAQSSSAATHH